MKILIVELFYRIYYALLTSLLLFCFAYFTHAIQYEYISAYFANYYQACEFDFDQNIAPPKSGFEPLTTNFTNLNKENNDAKAWSFLSITYDYYFFSYDLKTQILNNIAMRNLFGYLLLNTCFQMHGFVLGGLLNIKRLNYYVILHLLILTFLFYYAFYNIYYTCLIDLLLEQLDSELNDY